MLRSIESPVSVLNELNRQFPIDPERWQYFTFFCAILDIPQKRLRYATAGHPGPVLLPQHGGPRVLDACGFPIGLFVDATYDEFTVELGPGDRLYFCSDGVTDAMSAEEEVFGADRLLQVVDTTRSGTLQESVSAISATVARWSGEHRPQDDLSVLALELDGGS
jgi:sigma-B regulation protein RsbU (phosphoserine phosphatase)